MNFLTIASINVNGTAEIQKQKQVCDYLNDTRADLILVQECHVEKFNFWPSDQQFVSFGSNRSRGCAILIKNRDIVLSDKLADNEGRLCSGSFSFSGTRYRITCVYAPNAPRARIDFFSSQLIGHLSVTQTNIIAGDFNCVSSLQLDHTTISTFTPVLTGTDELVTVCSAFQCYDLFRALCPERKLFTWHSQDGKIASRIDRFYVPDCLSQKYYQKPFPYSDHHMIFAELKPIAPFLVGPSYWKCNTSIFSNDDFRLAYTSHFLQWEELQPLFTDLLDWWEAVKLFTKTFVIQWCTIQGSLKQANIRELENSLSQCDPLSEPQRYNELKNQIRIAREENLASIKIRAKAECLEADEKVTAYFFKRFKDRDTARTITSAVDEHGVCFTDIENIKRVYHDYYSKLYSREDNVNLGFQEFFLSLLPDQNLKEPAQPSDSLSFTESEVKTAIKAMSNGKSPGSDGLPAEYYKCFSSLLAPVLTELYNQIASSGTLPNSMSLGLTTLLPKSGDPSLPANKRPISLLNTDYKILAKVINSMIAPVLSDFVFPTQTCSVRGRTINDNTILLRDLIFHASTMPEAVRPCFVSLDQRKAFDMVDHGFLFLSLSKAGVAKQLISLVRVMYGGARTQCLVNGFRTNDIFLHRGVRQGCPLSPTLYVIYVECLIRAVIENDRLSGITMPGLTSPVKALAYADDILVVCHHSQVAYLFSLTDRFTEATGSMINANKTRVLAWPASRLSVNPDWLVDQIKVCGVYYSLLPSTDIKNNWDKIFRKAKSKLDSLSSRRLSLAGKVVLINTLIFPMFHHVAMVYPPHKPTIKALMVEVFRFIWAPAVRQSVRQQYFFLPKSKGGWGLTSFELKARAMFLHSNIHVPVMKPAAHPRMGIFRFAFGRVARRMWPEVWQNTEPHSFSVPGPFYKPLKTLFDEASSLLDPASAATVEALYNGLLPESSPVPVKPMLPAYFVPEAVWSFVFSRRLGGYLNDFVWRIASGALKTGQVIARYNIPGSRVNCVFCGPPPTLETAVHLFVECPGLSAERNKLVAILRARGQNIAQDTSCLFGGGITEAASHYLLAKFYNIVWSARNKVLFGNETASSARHYIQALLSHEVSFVASFSF